jgi:methylated-DNA-[protein]-cysteine S-methyltransferase
MNRAPTHYAEIETPLGRLVATREDGALGGLYFDREPAPDWAHDPAGFSELERQLAEYFAGERTHFELPLAPRGTAFERRVWHELEQIPCGHTRSYGEIARALGMPHAARAVGRANGRNPISILIPCHRVVGCDGSLVGYAGGTERKRWLLDHERRPLP